MSAPLIRFYTKDTKFGLQVSLVIDYIWAKWSFPASYLLSESYEVAQDLESSITESTNKTKVIW